MDENILPKPENNPNIEELAYNAMASMIEDYKKNSEKLREQISMIEKISESINQ